MKYLFSLFLLLFCQVSVHAADARFRIDTAFHHDEAPTRTLEAAQLLDFKPYQGELRLGFVKGETWIRLQIQADASAMDAAQTTPGERLVLRVGPYSLDQLTFYVEENGQWVAQQGGDRFVKSWKNCPDDLYCFSFDAPEGSPVTAYLKIQTDTVRVVHTALVSSEQVMPNAIGRIQQMTVSLTLGVAVLVLSLAFLFLERSVLLHVFCWLQASAVFMIAANTGLLAQWLPMLAAETVNHMSNLGQVIRVPFVILLGWAALRACRPAPFYPKAVMALLMACGMNLLWLVTGHTDSALKINFVVMWINSMVQLWGVLSSQNFPPKLRTILLTGWSVFLVLATLGVLATYGFSDDLAQITMFQSIGDWRLNGVPIGMAVFWIVATEKSNRKIEKLKELQGFQMEAAQSKAHQEKLKERRDLIDMLTHELKTPLSTIKFALASLKMGAKGQGDSMERVQRIDASVNRMDAMIEHVALSNKIERHDVRDSAEKISAQELMNVVMQEYQNADRFELRIQEGAFFRADPHFLALIVENLVSNAVKYSTDGKIKITIGHETPDMTCFSISNCVAKESLPDENRLFERYYRHPNFQNHPGMGIGLSLVHSAAEKMGATVSYLHTDQEVVFEVRIPH
ncbi:ATP-binding protein [Limnohabitans sp. Rim8]|uniref:sensor histidine kinase n=1 Tax=Limnohabitans sp. Rim8 TaxID=1100718 RepID=UPI0025E81B83|nr:ATP-binding protein [Limnohabitans sp. Rim8]